MQDYDVSRRSLLKAAGLASMAGVATSMFGDVMTSTVYGAGDGNVLVVVSLRGGADGLSMVVPHGESAYYSARPTTGVAANSLLHQDATFGLHPAFAKLSPMWLLGQMAAIHAVGLPAPNRSHFEAMELVEDADPGSAARVGWVNHMVAGLAESPDVFDGIQVGSTLTPTALLGPAPVPATGQFSDLSGPFPKDAALRSRVVEQPPGAVHPVRGGDRHRERTERVDDVRACGGDRQHRQRRPARWGDLRPVLPARRGAQDDCRAHPGQCRRQGGGRRRRGLGTAYVDLEWRVDQLESTGSPSASRRSTSTSGLRRDASRS